MNKMTESVTEAFRKARNQQVDNLRRSFKSIPEADDVVNKDEDETEDEEKVNKADESEVLDYALSKGYVSLEDEDGITKAVYTDTELNRTLGIVGERFDFEKSDVMDAMCGYESKITISKTGKEIKEQVKNVVLPAKKECLEKCSADANKLLSDCGDAPTRDVPKYWLADMDIETAYKFYDWDETYVPERGINVVQTLSASENVQGNVPSSVKEGQTRREYNDKVRNVCDCLVDIKACEILLNNIKDNEKFTLSPRQILVLKFN